MNVWKCVILLTVTVFRVYKMLLNFNIFIFWLEHWNKAL